MQLLLAEVKKMNCLRLILIYFYALLILGAIPAIFLGSFGWMVVGALLLLGLLTTPSWGFWVLNRKLHSFPASKSLMGLANTMKEYYEQKFQSPPATLLQLNSSSFLCATLQFPGGKPYLILSTGCIEQLERNHLHWVIAKACLSIKAGVTGRMTLISLLLAPSLPINARQVTSIKTLVLNCLVYGLAWFPTRLLSLQSPEVDKLNIQFNRLFLWASSLEKEVTKQFSMSLHKHPPSLPHSLGSLFLMPVDRIRPPSPFNEIFFDGIQTRFGLNEQQTV